MTDRVRDVFRCQHDGSFSPRTAETRSAISKTMLFSGRTPVRSSGSPPRGFQTTDSTVESLPRSTAPSSPVITEGFAESVILDQTSVQGFVDSIDVVAQTCKIQEKGKDFKAKFEPYLKKNEKEWEKKKILILVGRDYENSTIKDAYAVGDDRFLNEIISLCGATNAYTGNMAYPKIQLEGILSLDPDIVIDIITANDLTPEKLDFIAKSWSNLDINAVKNGKVFIKTEDFWSLPGPRFVKIIEEIKNILE